jgi:predicted dienelactone hydrolase
MIDTQKLDWMDSTRDRVVSVKIYSPRDETGPFPIIIFSHGLGSSRDVYGYLGRHWAGRGYVSVHLQHAGSDIAVWEKSPVSQRMDLLRHAASLPENFINRPKDVSFAIDELTRLNENDAQWKNRFDLNRIGVAGHSFGAFTALASVGEIFFAPDGNEISLSDSRIKAVIAMSPPVFPDEAQREIAYAQIKVPCFHMTGTADDSPIGETKASERRVAFDRISGADQYLVTFKDADHFIFSGRWRDQGGGEFDAMFQDLIAQSLTAFWDAYLKDDESALKWLREDFRNVLGDKGVFEQKHG